MRGCVAFGAVILAATPVLADWQPMNSAQITSALAETTLQYETARQVFYASGRTLYDAGRPSWGYWEARDDAYCSQWPPANGWACYSMERNAKTGNLRFIGESGDITEGEIVE